jgi:uncharacterized membrane protein YfcA
MPEANALDYFWLCVSAFLAGGVNALAGGGTLLTFPTLIGVLSRQMTADLAKVFANGTSTTALVPASLGSAWAFRRELFHLRRFLVWLLPPSIVGAAIGTLLVILLPPAYFSALVPWLILAAAVLFTVQPYLTRRKAVVVPHKEVCDAQTPILPDKLAGTTVQPYLTKRKAADVAHEEICDADTPIPPARLAGMVALQFLIAIYGGYFGAGIGILMLGGLGLMGLSNIHQMNGLKAVLGTAINGVAVATFLIGTLLGRPAIVWPYALAMAATSLVGGYVAAHFSRQVPGKFVRWIVIAIGFCLAAFYLWKQFAPASAASAA